MALTLTIISPDDTLYKGSCTCVFLPGTKGRFEILEKHAAIISSLKPGVIEYRNESGAHTLDIQGGFMEMNNNNVVVCVEI